MNFVEVTADARSDFYVFRRFEASDILVPFDHLARDWLDDRYGGCRSGLRGVLSTARDQRDEQERRDSQQGVCFHRDSRAFIIWPHPWISRNFCLKPFLMPLVDL